MGCDIDFEEQEVHDFSAKLTCPIFLCKSFWERL